MSENTEYPTGSLGEPGDTRDPADYEDPETYQAALDPDADPDVLNPRDTLGEDPLVQGLDDDLDTDADPDALDPRDVR